MPSHTGNLGRVDDTGCEQVLIAVCTGIVTEVALALADLLGHYAALDTCILGDGTQRSLDGLGHDVDTGLLVLILTFQSLQGLDSADECHTATRDDTFLDCCTGSVQSVLYPVLLLLHLDLGG